MAQIERTLLRFPPSLKLFTPRGSFPIYLSRYSITHFHTEEDSNREPRAFDIPGGGKGSKERVKCSQETVKWYGERVNCSEETDICLRERVKCSGETVFCLKEIDIRHAEINNWSGETVKRSAETDKLYRNDILR